MDLSGTIAPTSDQLDAIELIGGPRTFVIASVSAGNAEQPVNIHLEGFPRPWRPGKSMRRVLVAAWGPDASAYVGRRVTLFCDDSVMFGKDRVGGTRISHMSDLPGGKRFSTPLLISRGKAATYTVEPLPGAPTKPARTAEPAPDIESITDRDQLRAMWRDADPDTRARITARVNELDTATVPAEPEGWDLT